MNQTPSRPDDHKKLQPSPSSWSPKLKAFESSLDEIKLQLKERLDRVESAMMAEVNAMKERVKGVETAVNELQSQMEGKLDNLNAKLEMLLSSPQQQHEKASSESLSSLLLCSPPHAAFDENMVGEGLQEGETPSLYNLTCLRTPSSLPPSFSLSSLH